MPETLSTPPISTPPVVAGAANCLIVDDEPSVRRSLVRMLQAQGFTCFEAGSGREALGVLERIGEAPLVISDMKMPELDGIGLLEALREHYPDTSVIMLTGMSETSTAVDCLHMGAADFLLKPISVGELQARVSRVLEKRALVLQNRFYQQHLERQVHEQAVRIQELFLQGVQMLARALEAKDAYTRGHSIRVSQYAVGTAQRLGFDGGRLDGIRLGGELHDIGKIGTREAVLHKPGTLTPEEFRQITEHPALGERMLLPLAQESPDVLRIVRSHHERLDGRGFPDGLRGEKIPIEARIVAVADAFDAMTTERPYRDARQPDDAVAELRRVAGTQLDPAAVEAFVDAFPEPGDLPLLA
ncbi:MAG TPA: HD domain-containing phosphohydrolase [Gemmatimonadales bacterium]|jgi:response regulator RpfG family c-di-GMP phosphodiesterase|nr:HD domain-containing phosphohydrolase [Gemmatimonadales bacterium]